MARFDNSEGTPDHLNRELSNRIEEVMLRYAPNAKRINANTFEMGDLDGAAGKSTRVFRGRGGVFIAKDNATGESINILGLVHRLSGGSWGETLAEVRSYVGISLVKPIIHKERKRPEVTAQSAGVKPISGTPALDYLRDERGIPSATLKKYRVRSVDRPSKMGNTHFWAESYYEKGTDKLMMVKSTGLKRDEKGRKDIYSTSPVWPTLWGWWLVDDNTKEIVITEGCIDAMSMEALGCIVPALSMPGGCGDLSWIDMDYDHLQNFEKIYVCTDMDEPGEKAAKEICKRLGMARCFRVRLPKGFNDVNDLKLNLEDEHFNINNLLAEATTYHPDRIQSIDSLIDEAITFNRDMEEAIKDRDFAFPSMDFKLLDGDTGILTGQTAHGKTEITTFIYLNELKNGKNICIAALDTPAPALISNIAWTMFGKRPTEYEIRLCCQYISERVYFINLQKNSGDQGESITVAELLSSMDYAHKRFGCTRFLIDNLSMISDIGKDEYDKQDNFVKSVDSFDKRNGTNTMIVAHALMPQEGSEYKIPGRRDVEGSKGMIKPIQYGLTIWRNKIKEEPHLWDNGDHTPERIKKLIDGHDVYFSVWKQRNGFRSEFTQGLKYDRDSRWYCMPYEHFKSPFPINVTQTEVLSNE